MPPAGQPTAAGGGGPWGRPPPAVPLQAKAPSGVGSQDPGTGPTAPKWAPASEPLPDFIKFNEIWGMPPTPPFHRRKGTR